jgi:hypothetical protein
MQSLSDAKTSVFESNPGIVDVSCPWCIHKQPFGVKLIVGQEMVPEMFYTIRNSYERILYLQHWDAKRIAEETKLRRSIINRRPAITKAPRPAPACSRDCRGS